MLRWESQEFLELTYPFLASKFLEFYSWIYIVISLFYSVQTDESTGSTPIRGGESHPLRRQSSTTTTSSVSTSSSMPHSPSSMHTHMSSSSSKDFLSEFNEIAAQTSNLLSDIFGNFWYIFLFIWLKNVRDISIKIKRDGTLKII